MAKIVHKAIVNFLCIGLCGCGLLFPQTKKLQEREEAIIEKDQEIKRLKETLDEKERLLREKDSKIEQLRKQLESVGVFE